MSPTPILRVFVAILALLTCLACGGSGGSAGGPEEPASEETTTGGTTTGTAGGPFLAAPGGIATVGNGDEDGGNGETETIIGPITGKVTTFTDTSDFVVGDQPVRTDEATGYEDGVASDVAEGVILEVEGKLAADGVLLAERIAFPIAITVAAEVDHGGVNVEAGTISLIGSVMVETNTSTELLDSLDDKDPFTIADIQGTNRLEVDGILQEDGTVLALRVERGDKSDPESILQGPVESVIPPTTIFILGVRINISGAKFRDTDGKSIGSGTFFDVVQAGAIQVKVKGPFDSFALLATEVELAEW